MFFTISKINHENIEVWRSKVRKWIWSQSFMTNFKAYIFGIIFHTNFWFNQIDYWLSQLILGKFKEDNFPDFEIFFVTMIGHSHFSSDSLGFFNPLLQTFINNFTKKLLKSYFSSSWLIVIHLKTIW